MALNKNKVIAAAQRFTQKGQFDRAIKEYSSIVDEDPDDVRIWLKIGDLHTKRGAISQAISTYVRVANNYAEKGFHLKSVAVYKKILTIDPSSVDAHKSLGDLYVHLGLGPDAVSQYQIVVGAYEREARHHDSLELLKRIVQLGPEDYANRIRLAEAHARLEEQVDAVEQFKQVLQQLEQASRLDDYVQVAERLLYIAPEELDVVRDLSQIYLRRGDAKRALARLQVLFRANPTDISTLELLAKAFHDIGQTTKAVSVYRELARVHGEAGDTNAQVAAYRKLLTINPEDEEAQRATGGIEVGAKTPSPAVGMAGTVEEHLSREEQIEQFLGDIDIYRKYGLNDHARERLAKVLELDAGNVRGLERKRDMCLEADDRPGAIAALLLAAQSCGRTDPSRAMGLLGEVLQYEPGHAEATERMKALSSGMAQKLSTNGPAAVQAHPPAEDAFDVDLDLGELDFDDEIGAPRGAAGFSIDVDSLPPAPDDDPFGDLLEDDALDQIQSGDFDLDLGDDLSQPSAPVHGGGVIVPPPAEDDFGGLLDEAPAAWRGAEDDFGDLLEDFDVRAAGTAPPAVEDGFGGLLGGGRGEEEVSFDDAFADLLAEPAGPATPPQTEGSGGLPAGDDAGVAPLPVDDGFGDLLAEAPAGARPTGRAAVPEAGDDFGDLLAPDEGPADARSRRRPAPAVDDDFGSLLVEAPVDARVRAPATPPVDDGFGDLLAPDEPSIDEGFGGLLAPDQPLADDGFGDLLAEPPVGAHLEATAAAPAHDEGFGDLLAEPPVDDGFGLAFAEDAFGDLLAPEEPPPDDDAFGDLLMDAPAADDAFGELLADSPAEGEALEAPDDDLAAMALAFGDAFADGGALDDFDVAFAEAEPEVAEPEAGAFEIEESMLDDADGTMVLDEAAAFARAAFGGEEVGGPVPQALTADAGASDAVPAAELPGLDEQTSAMDGDLVFGALEEDVDLGDDVVLGEPEAEPAFDEAASFDEAVFDEAVFDEAVFDEAAFDLEASEPGDGAEDAAPGWVVTDEAEGADDDLIFGATEATTPAVESDGLVLGGEFEVDLDEGPLDGAEPSAAPADDEDPFADLMAEAEAAVDDGADAPPAGPGVSGIQASMTPPPLVGEDFDEPAWPPTGGDPLMPETPLDGDAGESSGTVDAYDFEGEVEVSSLPGVALDLEADDGGAGDGWDAFDELGAPEEPALVGDVAAEAVSPSDDGLRAERDVDLPAPAEAPEGASAAFDDFDLPAPPAAPEGVGAAFDDFDLPAPPAAPEGVSAAFDDFDLPAPPPAPRDALSGLDGFDVPDPGEVDLDLPERGRDDVDGGEGIVELEDDDIIELDDDDMIMEVEASVEIPPPPGDDGDINFEIDFGLDDERDGLSDVSAEQAGEADIDRDLSALVEPPAAPEPAPELPAAPPTTVTVEQASTKGTQPLLRGLPPLPRPPMAGGLLPRPGGGLASPRPTAGGGFFDLRPPPAPPRPVDEIDGTLATEGGEPELDATIAADLSELDEELAELDFMLESGLRDDARELLAEFEEEHPGHAAVVSRRARLAELEAAGDDADKALGALDSQQEFEDVTTVHGEQVGDLSEDDANTHFDLGVAYKEMGQYRKAIESLEKASRSRALRVESLRFIGLCHLEQGDFQAAASHLEAALTAPDIAPQARAGVQYDLAGAYESLGRTQEAIAQLQAILSAGAPDFLDVQTRLARLRP